MEILNHFGSFLWTFAGVALSLAILGLITEMDAEHFVTALGFLK